MKHSQKRAESQAEYARKNKALRNAKSRSNYERRNASKVSRQMKAYRLEKKSRGKCIIWACEKDSLARRVHCEEHRAESCAASRKHKRGTGRFGQVIINAKKRGLSFTLTKFEYEKLAAEECFYCGLPTRVQIGVGLDRVDNAKGYDLGNVVSCCAVCNIVRGDFFTVDEMQSLGKLVREIRLRRQALSLPDTIVRGGGRRRKAVAGDGMTLPEAPEQQGSLFT